MIRIAVILAFVNTLAYIDRQVLALLFDPIGTQLGLSDTQLGALQGVAFAVPFALAAPAGGWLADRVNRVALIAFGVALWSIATFATGAARSFEGLLAARMLVGVGEACLAPAAYSLLAASFPRNRFGRAFGIYQFGAPLGAGAAFVLGGLVYRMASEHGQSDAPVLGVWLTAAPWQQVLTAFGLAGLPVLLLLTLVRDPGRSGGGSAADTGPRAALAWLGAQRATYVPLFAALACIAAMSYATSAWAITHVVRNFGLPLSQAGTIYGSMVVLTSCAGLVCAGLLCDALAQRGIAAAHWAVMIVSLVLAVAFGTAAAWSSNPWTALQLAIPAHFLAVFPFGAGVPAIQLLTPARVRGQVSGLYMLCVTLFGISVGPVAVGFLTDRVFGDSRAVGDALGIVILVLGLTAAGFLLAVRVPFARSLENSAAEAG